MQALKGPVAHPSIMHRRALESWTDANGFHRPATTMNMRTIMGQLSSTGHMHVLRRALPAQACLVLFEHRNVDQGGFECLFYRLQRLVAPADKAHDTARRNLHSQHGPQTGGCTSIGH